MLPNKRTLLAVLAHPDDETFGIGGTLALCATQGISTHLLCATHGEAGNIDQHHLQGYTSIAELRKAELECAAKVLGLSSVQLLNYRDSGMTGSVDNGHPKAFINATTDEVVAKISQVIRQLRPQVIITFDPLGGYKHPDHIKVHHATRLAYHKAADTQFDNGLPAHRTEKLYYHIFPKDLLRIAVRVFPLLGMNPHTFGKNHDIDLVEIVKGGNFPVHLSIDISSVRHLKDEASACHASQSDGGKIQRGPFTWFMRHFGNKEHFMRAYPPAKDDLREEHLFSGISSS